MADHTWSCRLCLMPCRYLIIDKTGYALLPGYCDVHGADMLRPLTTAIDEAPPVEHRWACHHAPRCATSEAHDSLNYVQAQRALKSAPMPSVADRLHQCIDTLQATVDELLKRRSDPHGPTGYALTRHEAKLEAYQDALSIVEKARPSAALPLPPDGCDEHGYWTWQGERHPPPRETSGDSRDGDSSELASPAEVASTTPARVPEKAGTSTPSSSLTEAPVWCNHAPPYCPTVGECQMRRRTDEPTTCLPAHDGGANLRPHGTPGWWQVWSGGVCISLLRPEDVDEVRRETVEACAKAVEASPNGVSERIEEAAERVRALQFTRATDGQRTGEKKA